MLAGAYHDSTEVSVKELQAHLAKVRSDAAECLLLSTLATDKKSDMFAKMAEHLNGLASEIEKSIGASATPAPLHAKATVSDSVAADDDGAIAKYTATNHQEGVLTTNVAAPFHKTTESRRKLAWLALIVVAVIAGLFLWANGYIDLVDEQGGRYLSSFIGKSKTPRDDEKKAIAALLSSEQSERKAILEQLATLAARIDRLQSELEKLEIAPARVVSPSDKAPSGEEKPPTTETKPAAPEQRSSTGDEDRTFTVQNPPPAKLDTTSSNSPVGRVSRVGTIEAAGTIEAGRRAVINGPPGCEHFRSFDIVSGSYMTFDGRRRPCR